MMSGSPSSIVLDLDARLERLAGEYERRRSAACAAVVRWDWYSSGAFDLRPLYYEQHTEEPGRRLAERPDKHHHRIGFDVDDRPVAFIECLGILDGLLDRETYRDYQAGPGIVEQACFRAGGQPIHLHEYRFDEGLIRSASSVTVGDPGGYEEYQYTGDRVTRVVIHRAARMGGSLGPLTPYLVIDAVYDDAGQVRLNTVLTAQPVAEPTYVRPPAGFTTEAASRTVHEELIKQIPAAVRRLEIDKSVYCIVLGYTDQRPLDVIAHVGLAEERRGWLAEHPGTGGSVTGDGGGEFPGLWWSPCEFSTDTPIDLDAVEDTARLLEQELWLVDPDDDPEFYAPESLSEGVRVLLCAVAAELNAYDWSRILPITDDFVAYAVDWELTDFERNMPACVPPARLAILRERGLL